MATDKKWQGLELKLSEGKSLEQAARECLIPTDDAKEYFKARTALDDFETDLCARTALEEALKVYRQVLKELEGDYDKGEKEGDAPYIALKLKAAEHLHKHYMTERARLDKKIKKAEDETAEGQGSIFGDWKLKVPE